MPARIVAARAPAESELQTRLDQFIERYSGPYRVGEHDVRVAAEFRMNGGRNERRGVVSDLRRALGDRRFRELGRDIPLVLAGKGSPDQLRRLTQALIDSPAFDKYRGLEPAIAIRKLQWEHCIGMDCSGYVHQAFLYARGTRAGESAPAARYAFGKVDDSGLQRMPGPLFQRVKPSQARAGDVIVLTNAADDHTGHKVIVRTRSEVPGGSDLHSAAARAFSGQPGDRIHYFEVDSSWGAGDGSDPTRGGVKRVTWLYDDSLNRWADLERGKVILSSKPGPYDHDLHGVFRPKSET